MTTSTAIYPPTSARYTSGLFYAHAMTTTHSKFKPGDQIKVVRTFKNYRNQPTSLLGKVCRVSELRPDYMLAKAGDGKHHRVPYDAAEPHVPQGREYLPNNNSYSRSRAHERAMVREMGQRAERICTGTASGHYSGDELTRSNTRPGADDHRRCPSRMGGQAGLPGRTAGAVPRQRA